MRCAVVPFRATARRSGSFWSRHLTIGRGVAFHMIDECAQFQAARHFADGDLLLESRLGVRQKPCAGFAMADLAGQSFSINR